ncbi:hypothetical protein [Undibacterium sp. Xuan67W]|uniref:hypothetical protein n=1 Tax=Undibacterium sp. Xuan67W TaxID=3413057 RepID=UPI003BF13682
MNSQTDMLQNKPVLRSPRSRSIRVLRRIMWVLLGFVVLILLFIVGVMFINLHDESLSPEVRALMQAPVYKVADKKNGFFILRAIDADPSLDAFKSGREIVASDERRYLQNPITFDQLTRDESKEKKLESTWDQRRCISPLNNCMQADLTRRAELEKLLVANQILLQRYMQMQVMEGFEEHVIPTPGSPIPNMSPLVQAAEMVMVLAEFDIADGKFDRGIQRLQQNDRYLRSLMRNTSTLISRMVSIAIIRKQAKLVSDLVELKPELLTHYRQQLSELVRPLSQEEKNFVGVFTNEARFFTFLQYLLHQKNDSREDIVKGFFSKKLGRFFYQPNATMNQILLLWSERIALLRQSPLPIDTMRQQAAARSKAIEENMTFPYTHYFYNPIGKILAYVSEDTSATYVTYLERSIDLDGYLSLVSLQMELRSQHITESGISEYLAKASPALRNPYDASPMTWDAQKRQLQFTGRQKASSNLNGGKLYIVQLSDAAIH